MQSQDFFLIGEDRMENILSHSDPEFPIYITENNLIDPNSNAHLWHWHHAIQLCTVTDGSIIFHTDGESFLVKPGDGIFINDGCIHRSEAPTLPHGKYICVDFDIRLLQSFFGSVMESHIYEFMSNNIARAFMLSRDTPWMNSILDSVIEIYRQDQKRASAYELFICGHLFKIMGNLCRYSQNLYQKRGNHAEHSLQMREVISYIHNHYTHRISLGKLAEIAHVSESEFCRLFKRYFHCTAFSYILECRLRKSIELLLYTESSVTQIAYLCGFSSTSYYIRQFKASMGCTPLSYKNAHKTSCRITCLHHDE